MAAVVPGVIIIVASSLDDPGKFVTQMSVFAPRAWDPVLDVGS